MNTSKKTSLIAKMAIMAAISCVLVLLIRIPFPPAPFLVYDPADVPIYISTFAFGPISGMLITITVSFIQAFFLMGDSWYGFIMHIASTGTYVIIAGLIYSRNKNKKTAILALCVGMIATTAAMCVANYFVTPAFLGTPREAVVEMLIPIIIPFNMIKGTINGVITYILYKRISSLFTKN